MRLAAAAQTDDCMCVAKKSALRPRSLTLISRSSSHPPAAASAALAHASGSSRAIRESPPGRGGRDGVFVEVLSPCL